MSFAPFFFGLLAGWMLAGWIAAMYYRYEIFPDFYKRMQAARKLMWETGYEDATLKTGNPADGQTTYKKGYHDGWSDAEQIGAREPCSK